MGGLAAVSSVALLVQAWPEREHSKRTIAFIEPGADGRTVLLCGSRANEQNLEFSNDSQTAPKPGQAVYASWNRKAVEAIRVQYFRRVLLALEVVLVVGLLAAIIWLSSVAPTDSLRLAPAKKALAADLTKSPHQGQSVIVVLC